MSKIEQMEILAARIRARVGPLLDPGAPAKGDNYEQRLSEYIARLRLIERLYAPYVGSSS